MKYVVRNCNKLNVDHALKMNYRPIAPILNGLRGCASGDASAQEQMYYAILSVKCTFIGLQNTKMSRLSVLHITPT